MKKNIISFRATDNEKEFLKAVARQRRQTVSEFINAAILHECGLSEIPTGNWQDMSKKEVENAIINATGKEKDGRFIVSPADLSIIEAAFSSSNAIKAAQLQNRPLVIGFKGHFIKAMRKILSLPTK